MTKLDVVGVGNALVDVIADADDAFLETHEIIRGGMVLIDNDKAASIYSAMSPNTQASGGSAANSIACVASFGGRGGFIGKISNDALGEVFASDMAAMGVTFDTPRLSGDPATGCCLIAVTDDAQRSMSTCLGAASQLTADDIDEAFVADAKIIFYEGYQFELPTSRAGFVKASIAARKHNCQTAITLSDAGVVDRQFESLVPFLDEHIDILLANHDEAVRLFETDDIATITQKARALCPLTAITMSEKGSLLIPRDGDVVTVPAVAPTSLVDTTGAGDAYAAGLLFGLARGFELKHAGALGSLAAAEVISHYGARPLASLLDLAKKSDLL